MNKLLILDQKQLNEGFLTEFIRAKFVSYMAEVI